MYVEFGDVIPLSVDQGLMTVKAIGVATIMTKDIPEIEIILLAQFCWLEYHIVVYIATKKFSPLANCNFFISF
jgi:hypothetical protein